MNIKDNEHNVDDLVYNLTARQFDVLTCLLFNVTAKAIGKTLNIQYRTVQGHLQAICKKIGVDNKNDLLKFINLRGSPSLQKDLKQRFKELELNISSVSRINHSVIQRNPENNQVVNKTTNSYGEYIDSKDITINQEINCSKSDENDKNIILKKTVIVKFIIALFVCTGIVWFYTSQNKQLSFSKINRNIYILRRERDLKKLKKTDPNQFSIKVLYGCGGSGKTTIAREYLKRLKSSVKYEINASSYDTLFSELIGLACALTRSKKQQESLLFINQISNPIERLRQVSRFVYDNLNDVSSWCILFDNVDDFNLLNQTCINTLPSLETISKGQILITTRNHDPKLFIDKTELIQVSLLSDVEKEKLFSKISRKRITSDIKLVLNEIPDYPLDVACFAYYAKNLKISGNRYFEQMHNGEGCFWDNNKKIMMNNTDYPFTRQEISKTVLDKIINTNREFNNILFLMSYMDQNNIPVIIFEDIFGSPTLYELMITLTKFGIAKFVEGNLSFSKDWFKYMKVHFEETMSDTDKLENLSKLISTVSLQENLLKKGVSIEEFNPHLNRLVKNLNKHKDMAELRKKLSVYNRYIDSDF